jgi:soluble lytic murein transglycosylase-like protein
MNPIVAFLACAAAVLVGSFNGCEAEASEPVSAREALAVLCPSRVNLAPAFERAARRYRLPAALLVAMARNESTCNPLAVSKSGKDVGLLQVRLGTAAARGHTAEELKRPGLSAMLGARHLAGKLRLCEDVPAALGVYAGWDTCELGRASGYAQRVLGFWNEVEGAKRS